MSVPDGFLEELVQRSLRVRGRLKADPKLGKYIDEDLHIPMPFVGSGPIKLVIVGQDPTIGSKKGRHKITQVLMLDRGGSLKSFLQDVCAQLGVKLEDNVYATNVCKNFFTDPPRNIKDVKVVKESGGTWLPILRDELALFPETPILTLGEPILEVLLRPDKYHPMKWFWGHRRNWQHNGVHPFRLVEPEDTTIARRFYPFIHQNSKSRPFYKKYSSEYLAFVRKQIEKEAA